MSDQQPVGEELRTLAVLAAHQRHSLMFFDRLVENGYVERWPSGYGITEKGRALLAARAEPDQLPERPDEALREALRRVRGRLPRINSEKDDKRRSEITLDAVCIIDDALAALAACPVVPGESPDGR